MLTFASDTCLAECVDDDGRPALDGVASSRVLLTNLHNLTQPLIRYELTDRFTPMASPGGGFLRARVDGRTDDLFRYATASVHPFVIGAVLARAPAVREFQVRQTSRGADVAAIIDGAPDPAPGPGPDPAPGLVRGLAVLAADIEDGLRQAGLPAPLVTIRPVAALDRDPLTGKARRFVPLGVRPAGTT